MAFNYNVDEVPPADLPCVEHDIRRAKKFLQKHSPESGDSLYDHLTEILNKILAERPKNAVDIFEQYSRQLKEERFRSKTDHLRDIYVPPAQFEEAKKLIELFQFSHTSEDLDESPGGDEDDDGTKKKKPNMLDLLYYFEQTGVGLPRSEMVILNLSIRKLMASNPIENVRFWGKILGNPKNYWIVEAELQEEEISRRLEEAEAEIEKNESEIEAGTNGAEEGAGAEGENQSETKVEGKSLVLVYPPMPETHWKPESRIPPEKLGTGTNKKTYFACGSPGLDEWIELPIVTAEQIVAARLLVRSFTGDLDTPIYTFPPFPGTEKNYLRAQIARITAATSISPIGWYNFGGDEEEEEEVGEEEEGLGGNISENPHYDPLPLKDLIDPSLSNWCHHRHYILKQGRTTWWNPNEERDEEEFAEEEENEEEEVSGSKKKEVGPPLLTPLSEDASVDAVPAWTARQSSFIQPDTSVAIVRSNLWPGAVAFATGKKYDNLYIGWGQKYRAYNYSPPSMPVVQDQYRIGPEVMEVQDPTFEQEETWRIAHLPVPPLPPMGEEEELSGEASPDEEDDEDDEEDE